MMTSAIKDLKNNPVTFFCARPFLAAAAIDGNGDNCVVTIVSVAATVKVGWLFRLGVICKKYINALRYNSLEGIGWTELFR